MSLADLLFGKNDPGQSANEYLSQIPGVLKQYQEPFVQRGEQAGGVLGEQFGQMAQNPTDLINQLMEAYEPSKGYQFQQEQLGRAASNTAAAGGFRGTPYDVQQQQQLTQGLLSQDMQNWLQNVLGVKGAGLSGEQDLYGKGATMASGLSGDLSNVLGTQGQLAFQGQREKQQRTGDLLSGLASAVGSVAGLPVAGGGSLGGNFASKFF